MRRFTVLGATLVTSPRTSPQRQCNVAFVPMLLRSSEREPTNQSRPENLGSRENALGPTYGTRFPNRSRFARCRSLRGGSLNRRAAVPPRILCLAFSGSHLRSHMVEGVSKSQCG